MERFVKFISNTNFMNLPLTTDPLLNILILIIFYTLLFWILRLLYRFISNELGEFSIGVDKPLIVINYAWWTFIILSFFLAFIIFLVGTYFSVVASPIDIRIVGFTVAFSFLFILAFLHLFLTKKIELYNDRIVQSFILFKTRKAVLSKARFSIFNNGAILLSVKGINIYEDGHPRFIARLKGVSFFYSLCPRSDKKRFFKILAKLSGRSTEDLEYPGTFGSQRLIKDNHASPDSNQLAQSTKKTLIFDDDDEEE